MNNLNLPAFQYKIKHIENKAYIYDILRKKFILITPEEWVRQHFVNYLIGYLSYPKQLIANEVSIRLNSTSKRCDTVIYKSPEIDLSQAVFDQALRYNMVLRVKYIILSNGIKHICCKIDYDNNKYIFLSDIPKYEDL